MIKYLYISLIIFTLVSCNSDSLVKTNVFQSSFDVAQSKSLGVFINEYDCSTKELNLMNSSIEIKEVWSEYYWSYKNQSKEIEIRDRIKWYVKITPVDSIDVGMFIYDDIKQNGISNQKLTFEPQQNHDTINVVFLGQEVSFIRK